MITILTNAKTVYINIDLLKARVKKAVVFILNVLVVAFAVFGIFWIIGTEGASERITATQLIKQMLQGLLCCGVAWVLNFIKSVIK